MTFKKLFPASLSTLALAFSASAFAEEATQPVAPAQQTAATPVDVPQPTESQPDPKASSSAEAATLPAPKPEEKSQALIATSSSVPVRLVLRHSAQESAAIRYRESFVGLATAGSAFGVGFVAQAPDMTWSHLLWVTSGVAFAGSLANLFVPSSLEGLASESGGKTDEQLRREWQKLAEKARIERRTNAVISGLLGTTSIVLGSLAFEGKIGSLTDEQRKIIGATLVTGGALGVTDAVVDWFVPSPTESGYELANDAPKVSFAVAPTPNGAHLALEGRF